MKLATNSRPWSHQESHSKLQAVHKCQANRAAASHNPKPVNDSQAACSRAPQDMQMCRMPLTSALQHHACGKQLQGPLQQAKKHFLLHPSNRRCSCCSRACHMRTTVLSAMVHHAVGPTSPVQVKFTTLLKCKALAANAVQWCSQLCSHACLEQKWAMSPGTKRG
jgi:hypothetical protein